MCFESKEIVSFDFIHFLPFRRISKFPKFLTHFLCYIERCQHRCWWRSLLIEWWHKFDVINIIFQSPTSRFCHQPRDSISKLGRPIFGPILGPILVKFWVRFRVQFWVQFWFIFESNFNVIEIIFLDVPNWTFLDNSKIHFLRYG